MDRPHNLLGAGLAALCAALALGRLIAGPAPVRASEAVLEASYDARRGVWVVGR